VVYRGCLENSRVNSPRGSNPFPSVARVVGTSLCIGAHICPLNRVPGSCFCASTIFSTENVYDVLTMSVNGVLLSENEGALCIGIAKKNLLWTLATVCGL
jgi:hypothetical protein